MMMCMQMGVNPMEAMAKGLDPMAIMKGKGKSKSGGGGDDGPKSQITW